MPSMLSAIFPPPPPLTAASLPSLDQKVYIVTGAASGVGFQLAKILYSKGATVYVAARSTTRCDEAIRKIEAQTKAENKGGKLKGRLEAMVIDLADLRTVKPATEVFLGKESRLDVLFHNAGVMTPPAGSKDKQGHDLEIGTNCLGPYLLTVLLQPILLRTAATFSPLQFGEVRIVWVVSLMQLGTPAGAMAFDAQGVPVVQAKAMENYMQSKAGGTWLAAEFAKRLGDQGILSVSVHPGLMRTELQRNMPALGRLMMSLVFKPPVYGAYSELYAGFSHDLKPEHNGGHTMAWGRIADLPDDIVKGMKSKSEGGTGAAQKFIEYCDREIKKFL